MTAPTNVRTCYRHPDRVAGISCQRCDRPICPSCMNQASVGFHCPECAKAGTQKVYQGVGSWLAKPIATQVLMGVSIVGFLAMLVTTATDPFTTGGKLLGLDSGDPGIFHDGSLYGPFVSEEPWRLLTSGFLHAPLPFGIVHIGFNMYLLWMLGRMIEPVIGHARFIALYFVAEAASTIGVVVLDPRSETIGASGAVFGLMSGAVLVARDRNIDLMRTGLPQTIGLNLIFTFSLPGVSIGGHVGGLIGGALGGALVVEGAKRMGSKGPAVSAGLGGVLALALFATSYVLMAGEYGDQVAPFFG